MTQRSTLSTVLGNTPSAVLVLDNEFRIRIYNEQAARLLKKEHLRGQLLQDALKSLDVLDEEQAGLLNHLQSSIHFHDEVTIGQDTYNVEGALMPSLQQWVLAWTDITGLIELSKLKTRMLRNGLARFKESPGAALQAMPNSLGCALIWMKKARNILTSLPGRRKKWAG